MTRFTLTCAGLLAANTNNPTSNKCKSTRLYAKTGAKMATDHDAGDDDDDDGDDHTDDAKVTITTKTVTMLMKVMMT